MYKVIKIVELNLYVEITVQYKYFKINSSKTYKFSGLINFYSKNN